MLKLLPVLKDSSFNVLYHAFFIHKLWFIPVVLLT